MLTPGDLVLYRDASKYARESTPERIIENPEKQSIALATLGDMLDASLDYIQALEDLVAHLRAGGSVSPGGTSRG